MRCAITLAATVALLAVAQPARAELPVMRLDVGREIPDDPKVSGRLAMPGYRGRVGIERRGMSSQAFPKRSYALELRDRGGEDRRAGLLGMPPDGDWVLYAAYNDKTLMRNVVAYDVARAIGRYAPRTRYVHLRLDGRYQGVYVLAEKVELGKRRVAGEALLELTFPYQAQRKKASFRTPVRGRPIVWEDPARADIGPRRAARIAGRVIGAERALYGGGDWRAHLDEAAAVDYVLLQELLRNQDAFHASTFMVLGGDGRLRLGPVWDFDIAMGNGDYGITRRLEGWTVRERDWAEKLVRDPRFAAALATRWRTLRAAGLRDVVHASIGRAERSLHGSAGRNFRRWPVLDRRIWPNPRALGSHRAEVRHLRSWFDRRIAWLDREL
jgi:hypothetical protein